VRRTAPSGGGFRAAGADARSVTPEEAMDGVRDPLRYRFVGFIFSVDERQVYGVSSDDTQLILHPDLFLRAERIEIELRPPAP
jgi:hypothetical protein